MKICYGEFDDFYIKMFLEKLYDQYGINTNSVIKQLAYGKLSVGDDGNFKEIEELEDYIYELETKINDLEDECDEYANDISKYSKITGLMRKDIEDFD